jgi:anaphase-promoting complex subunit 5
MSRYLTPAKIVLLSLICIYTNPIIPNAAAMPILSFIVGNLIPLGAPKNGPIAASSSSSSSKSRTFILTMEDFHKVCMNYVSSIPGRTVWDHLLDLLWGISSFDALHVFFASLSFLVARSRRWGIPRPSGNRILLSRTSPLGTFVRRAQLEFVKIPFHESVTLWQNFVGYRQPTWAAWRSRTPYEGGEPFGVLLAKAADSDALMHAAYGRLRKQTSDEAQLSTDDVERLLEFQVDEMQS